MALAATLVELEAQPCGVGRCKPLENSGLERLQQLVKTSRGLPVSLDCRRKILAVSNDDITEVIIPLCSWLKGLVEGHNGEAGGGGRVLVGIVGPAAAGKSTLAQLLCAAGDVLWGDSYMKCVSMDGYSFPNSYLSAEPAVDHIGRRCTLKAVKGLPSTLDAGALLRDLRRLRSTYADTVLLPAYSRDLHDPVPDCVAVAPSCRIVIIEGLHLLHAKGKWKDISAALHRTVFLDIERSCCFQRVVGRKVANGRSRESSEAHFSRVDGPTFDQLQEERRRASLVLTVRPTEDRPLRIVDVEARIKPQEPRALRRSVSDISLQLLSVFFFPRLCF